jgi:hypothetical protein
VKAEDCTRVFLSRGTTAHLVPTVGAHDDMHPALCGFTPREVAGNCVWYGTATTEEYERALEYRLCARCEEALTRPAVS